MKKLVAILIIFMIACFAFVGCGNSVGKDNEYTDGGGYSDTVGDDSIGDNVENNGDGENGDKPQDELDTDKEEITKMYITINGNKLEVTLAKNSAVDALVEKLKQGDITYTADDYGGFEKVGGLGFSLPTDNSQITTQSGDVILYSGNQIVLFYGSNSWSYTRLGKIEGYSSAELSEKLGAGKGSVQVTLSLT